MFFYGGEQRVVAETWSTFSSKAISKLLQCVRRAGGKLVELGNKMTIHHKGDSVPDGLLPVEPGGGLLFCSDSSLLGNAGGSDNRGVD
jgi:hypothetical protein